MHENMYKMHAKVWAEPSSVTVTFSKHHAGVEYSPSPDSSQNTIA